MTRASAEPPMIKVRRGRMPSQPEARSLFDYEPASWASSATRVGMDDKQCLVFLQTRISEAQRSTRRHGHMFGRIYNAMTGDMANYVVLPGNILMRVLHMVQTCPQWLETTGEYELRLYFAETLLDRFRALVLPGQVK